MQHEQSSRYNIKNWCGEVLEKFQNSTRARDRRAQPQTGVRICIVKLDKVWEILYKWAALWTPYCSELGRNPTITYKELKWSERKRRNIYIMTVRWIPAWTILYLRHVDEHVAHGVGVRKWHCDHHVRRTQLLFLLRVGRRLAFALFHVLARENFNFALKNQKNLKCKI